MDMIRNMFPDNIIASAFQMHKTKISYEDIMLPSGNGSTQVPQFDRVKVDTINILGRSLFPAVTWPNLTTKATFCSCDLHTDINKIRFMPVVK